MSCQCLIVVLVQAIQEWECTANHTRLPCDEHLELADGFPSIGKGATPWDDKTRHDELRHGTDAGILKRWFAQGKRSIARAIAVLIFDGRGG